jgi:hypothetical protein
MTLIDRYIKIAASAKALAGERKQARLDVLAWAQSRGLLVHNAIVGQLLIRRRKRRVINLHAVRKKLGKDWCRRHTTSTDEWSLTPLER